MLGAPGVIGGGLPADTAETVANHEAAGQRVLLLGAAVSPADGAAPPKMITPVALLVLAERLRDDAAATVRYLLGQGITIKVLSGDAPATVAAIAARAGIPLLGAPRDASELGEGDSIGRRRPAGGQRPRPGPAWPEARGCAGTAGCRACGGHGR